VAELSSCFQRLSIVFGVVVVVSFAAKADSRQPTQGYPLPGWE